MWPQITILIMALMVLLINAYEHGNPKGKYNIWGAIVGVGIELFLLSYGGFFNNLFK